MLISYLCVQIIFGCSCFSVTIFPVLRSCHFFGRLCLRLLRAEVPEPTPAVTYLGQFRLQEKRGGSRRPRLRNTAFFLESFSVIPIHKRGYVVTFSQNGYVVTFSQIYIFTNLYLRLQQQLEQGFHPVPGLVESL